MQLIIAGYIAAPPDAAGRAAYYEELVSIPAASGLGLAWNGPATAAELQDVVSILPESWSVTLNGIGATLNASATDPAFGLASPDAAGRDAAMTMAREMRDSVHAISDRLGRKGVLAVEVHSAPGFGKGQFPPQADALRRSLEELVALDWEGTAVLVEHCDAYVVGQVPAKGFLTLEAEIAVLSSLSGGPVGLSLNWGRSVIERREVDGVVDHVITGADSGLLRAYTFSGAAGTDNSYGVAWADSHLPFSTTTEGPYGDPASLMTPTGLQQIAPYLKSSLFVATKTNWPKDRAEPMERAASVRANFETLVEGLE
jgi:hypothetical protein